MRSRIMDRLHHNNVEKFLVDTKHIVFPDSDNTVW